MSLNKILITIGILFIVCSSLFYEVMFSKSLFLPHDSLSAKSVNHGIEMAKENYGEYPLWAPWMFAGLPSTHSMQNISEYYFPHHIISLIKSVGLPWFWNYLLHFLFCGIGMYLLLKKIKLDFFSSLFGAISVVTLPWMVVNIVHGHGSQVMTAAYIPWIIWALIRLKEKPDIQNISILALMVGLQLQRAHVQIAYYTWLMMGLYILYNFIANYFSKKDLDIWFSVKWGISSLIGLCMSLWIYIPLLNYTPLSKRAIPSGDADIIPFYTTMWSLHPSEILTIILPSSFGFGDASYFGYMRMTSFPNYIGVLLILLVACAFYKNSNNNIKYYLLFISVFSILVSFGKYFFVYGVLYDWLPYFSKFRVPSMILVLFHFSLIVLASIGLNNLLNKIKEKDKAIIKFICCISSVILFLSVYRYLFADFSIINEIGQMSQQHPILNEYRTNIIKWDMIFVFFITISSISLLYYSIRKKINMKILACIFIILSFLDFYRVDYQIIHPNVEIGRSGVTNAPPVIKDVSLLNKQFEADQIINFFHGDTSRYRVYPYNQMDNRLFAFNIESVGGYHPAKLSIYEYLERNGAGIITKDKNHYDSGTKDRENKKNYINLNLLRMLNVKYILSLEEILEDSSLKLVKKGKYYINFQDQNAYVYELGTTEPRVQLLENLHPISSRKNGYVALKSPLFNVNEYSFISKEDFNDSPKISYNGSSTVNIKEWSPNKIIIQTKIKGDEDGNHFVLLSEIFFPHGWEISSHDNLKIVEVNNLLRGFFVPNGESKITLEFRPSDLKYGTILTYSSTLLILIMLLFSFIYKRDEKL